ncbi:MULTISPECIES: peptidoglycan-binding domain-containing protein [Rhodopseudomonas]|nr:MULTISPECIES: peptidoglycan-binding domain-containing protein [Rhodopseudomonas]MDF3811974.1 peptidoglycan-binding domain-containing protein [Rhodopseudomonas sp. BAL398]WOK20671.1 peptidoglycan-binding domain-containing protein [Rhodopseudomonas sp. BAL398]
MDESERGIVARLLLRSPKDLVAAMIASAAVVAIISNAIFMQAGRHPSPMFGTTTIMLPLAAEAESPLPRPRPTVAATRPEPTAAQPSAAEPRSVEIHHAAEPRKADPLAALMRTNAAPAAPIPVARPPAPIPSAQHDPLGDMIQSSRRIAAVQRTLTDYGYGQLKPTGTIGSDTQAAIQRFERARRIPVTGKMSDRLVRELSAMTGRPID